MLNERKFEVLTTFADDLAENFRDNKLYWNFYNVRALSYDDNGFGIIIRSNYFEKDFALASVNGHLTVHMLDDETHKVDKTAGIAVFPVCWLPMVRDYLPKIEVNPRVALSRKYVN